MKDCTKPGSFPLRQAQEGEQLVIAAIHGGKGLHDRLAGMGLRIGSAFRVLQVDRHNMLIGCGYNRFVLCGGMIHKIIVTMI